MIKNPLIPACFSFILLILGSGGCGKHANSQQMKIRIDWERLPDLPEHGPEKPLGVSAPFAGVYKNYLLVAGGCNFPDKLPAEGGSKEYYEGVYGLDLTSEDSEWIRVGSFPCPVAYGAAVTTPQGLVCIGGNNNEQSFPDVFCLSYKDQGDGLRIDSLPSLPVALDNMAATYGDRKIYVAGGNEEGKPGKSVYLLDQDHPGAGWKRVTSIPGNSRVQPGLAFQKAADGMRLFVSSGFQPIQEDNPAIVATDLLSWHPEKNEWRKESEFPFSAGNQPQTFTGGTCMAWGEDLLLFAGGVNYPVFSHALNFAVYLREADKANDTDAVDKIMEEMRTYMYHPVEWYQFNCSLLLYNTITKEWSSAGNYEQLARAGAGMVLNQNELFVINGELKPGVRTPEVNKAILKIKE